MEKKIDEYLHLYLGCECQIHEDDIKWDGSYKLTGVSYDDTQREWWAYFENTEVGYAPYSKVKPILRPLSDMTEEECWYSQNNFGHFVKETSEQYIQNRLHCIKETYTDFRNISPDQFLWLLKQQFDIFGLIESGIALDKTKLNQGTQAGKQ